MLNIFYVYVYLDPRKSGSYSYGDYHFEYEPFYVGKSNLKIKHEMQHIKQAKVWYDKGNQLKLNKIRKIQRLTGKDPIILKVKENISEQEAFNLEIKLIKLIGRIDLKEGLLTNLTDGGEGTFGLKRDDILGDKNPMRRPEVIKNFPFKYGEDNPTKRKEVRSKISESKKGNNYGLIGEKSSMFGLTHTEGTKKKISQSVKEKFKDPELRKKFASRGMLGKGHLLLGDKNGMYGKNHTEESKKKMSEKQKQKGISVKIYGIIYINMNSAGIALGVSGDTIKYRIKTGKRGYNYLMEDNI